MFRIYGFRILVAELGNRFTMSVRASWFMYLVRVVGLGYETWGASIHRLVAWGPVFTA